MAKPETLILVCMSFRGTEPKGKCIKQGSGELLPYIDAEIADRGLNAAVTSTGCLQFCEQGPVMVIQPQNWWYGGVSSEEVVDEILDALEEGKACEEYLIA